jgi:hypothetical protein
MHVDRKRLEAAIRTAEKDGPLQSQSHLWNAVKDMYNGTSLKGFKEQPEEAITFGIVRRYVIKKWCIPVKTQRQNCGRPETVAGQLDSRSTAMSRSATEALIQALQFMEDEAVREEWSKDSPGWEVLNQSRVTLGFKPVEPVNKPQRSHFSHAQLGNGIR